ncbi:MAG: kynurenine 3-monooxygenase [Cognaticolwellia sp.]|jgi:kynurenine 3-monooxygenase
MVTFSHLLPYSQTLALGDIQQEIMQKTMQIPNIEKCWQSDFVYDKLWQLAQAAFGAGNTDLVTQKNLTDYSKG